MMLIWTTRGCRGIITTTTAGVGVRFLSALPAHQLLTMPALSPTMTHGTLAKWKVTVGQAVKPGGVLAEIETDKATVDFESQEDGFVAKLILKEGTKEVKVGSPIAIVCESAKDVPAFANYVLPTTSSPAAAPVSPPS